MFLFFYPTDHPSRIGRFVNMNYEPKWQTCSDDREIMEKKSALGFTKLEYCLRCAVLDGWVHSKVSSGSYDACYISTTNMIVNYENYEHN